MESKKWIRIFLIVLIALLLFAGSLVLIIDPFFHYRAPQSFWKYTLKEERYQNNGILKYFNYDSIITGTSHTENFKTSEFDSLFNCNSVKVSLSGAQFKELANQTRWAINNKKNLKYILYGITYEDILLDKNFSEYKDFPTYLYDDNILNDYKYIFNVSALKCALKNLIYTINNYKNTSFDEYANWNSIFPFSKEETLKEYKRIESKLDAKNLTKEERKTIEENLKQNFIDIINLNKDIKYYIFFAPHSIAWWDQANQTGDILKYLEAEEIFINTLLEFDNVKLYSFFNKYDLICNLDKYRDLTHYSEDVNSQILKWIKNDEYLITKENKDGYLKEEREFYLSYDYDAIFE